MNQPIHQFSKNIQLNHLFWALLDIFSHKSIGKIADSGTSIFHPNCNKTYFVISTPALVRALNQSSLEISPSPSLSALPSALASATQCYSMLNVSRRENPRHLSKYFLMSFNFLSLFPFAVIRSQLIAGTLSLSVVVDNDFENKSVQASKPKI